MPLQSGARIGRYEIRSQLGAGGMGEVYLAHDTRRKVALKVLPAELINNRESLHRFEQEAQASSALNHPNIITIHEIGVEGDTHFIVTELIDGVTLRRKLQTTRVEIEQALTIITQIAAALDAAHRSDIVHRDIKPENIMLREDGLVKLFDFGLAKLTERKADTTADSQAPTRALVKTSQGVVMGTVAYMSPEQARGLEVDARTDLFSLGVVLYETLAGRLPFAGDTVSDVIATILKTEPVPLDEDTPAELQRIVRKALRKNVDERYQTAKDLLIDLKALKQEQDFAAQLERSGKHTKADQSAPTQNQDIHITLSTGYVVGGIKRHKFLAATLFATFVLALAIVGYFSFFASRNHPPITSIAVLPFVNESGNADVEYLSDGMTETLIRNLSQLANLNVKARSSVFRYKGKETDTQTIAKELNVQAVLIGKVRQRGNDLSLYVEFVDAATEKALWSETYQRPLANLVSLQNDIARDVANKLQPKLLGTDEHRLAKKYTENTEAYQLYLRGLFYHNKRTAQDFQKATEYFQQAVAVDPNYALAYAVLAEAYMGRLFYRGATRREIMPKAREAALKAVSLDAELAEAHAALGLVLAN
jgi:serine/threonine protein kinase